MEGVHPTFSLILALAAGVFAQSVARRIRVPGIVLLLLAGTGLGPDGLGWVNPRSLGDGLFALVDIAVAVILFEGGLNLQVSRLRREQASIRRLVTWGALVTGGGAGLAVSWILGWNPQLAALFGSLVVVTGPTVIGPLVSELRLRPRVATVLSAEGVLIDPIGAILAVLVLEVVLAPGSVASGAGDLVLRIGFGAVAGGAAGFALSQLLRIRNLLPDGHENIFVLAAVLLLFQGCELVVTHSGIMAVTLCGVVVGNLETLTDRDLREFKDQLSVLLVGLLFVMLAADVRFDDVRALGRPGLAVLGVLVLIVRPLGVWLSTLGSDLSARERLFIAWVAPRGIVAAAVASLVAGALEGHGVSGGTELRAMVFLTIGGTVVLAGFTAGPVAKWLGVRLPDRNTVAILGAEGLGLPLASELRDAGVPVIFLDSNPHTCRVAEEAGFNVVFGNAMEERTLTRARFEGVGTVVALTPNQTVNSAFVSRARELFRVPQAFVAVERPGTGLASDLIKRREAEIAFDGAHDLERWAVRARRDAVEVEHRVYRSVGGDEQAESEEAPAPGEHFAILTVRRDGKTRPMSASFELSDGDVAAVAIHTREREEADNSLAAAGWGERAGDDA